MKKTVGFLSLISVMSFTCVVMGAPTDVREYVKKNPNFFPFIRRR